MSTLTIEGALMKFSGGIFDGKNIRIAQNKYISVFDIIQIAGGVTKNSVHNTWKRIKEHYSEEVLTMCQDLKFHGSGQRETPCVNVQGLIKLLMWIPGERARKFRDLSADVMVRYLGGDLTLVNDVKKINTLHVQGGNTDIFRQHIQRKITYDEGYYVYIRVYNKFFEEQQKGLGCDNIKLSFYVIKFGIAKHIQIRESGYGNDNGFFQYIMKLPNRESAMFIEKLSRQDFKDLTVGSSYEYLHSKKLAKHLKVIPDENVEVFEKRDYYKTAQELYTKILIDYHLNFPEEIENFGIMYHPKMEQNDNEDIKITCTELNLDPSHLPSYKLPIKIESDKYVPEIKECSKQEIDETLQEELKFEKNRVRQLEELIKKNNPELWDTYNADKSVAEQHAKQYKKNKVYQYSLDGTFIKTFESVSAAARFYECSTKIIRVSCQNHKSFSGFLWRSSADTNDTSNLNVSPIEKCDANDYKILKIYNTFIEIDTEFKDKDEFVLNEVHRAINLGIIYYGYRWKFSETVLKIGQEIGRTGTRKRVAKMNEEFDVIAEFPSLLKATQEAGLKSKASLSEAIKNKSKSVGFYWKYL